jgi:hypothetical protein
LPFLFSQAAPVKRRKRQLLSYDEVDQESHHHEGQVDRQLQRHQRRKREEEDEASGLDYGDVGSGKHLEEHLNRHLFKAGRSGLSTHGDRESMTLLILNLVYVKYLFCF